MRKAVLCFAHKEPRQINVLIRQLLFETDGQTDVFIHFDKNHEELSKEIMHNSNVFLIKNNVPVTWGNDSMVKAFVSSLNEIVSTERDYDYFLVCTGQDLLVRKGLDEFLAEHYGSIYMDADERDDWMRVFLLHNFPKFMCRHIKKKTNPLRLMRAAYVTLIRMGLVPKRRINFDYSGWRFWYSFNWSAMPFEVAAYLNSFINENPGVLGLYQNTLLPEDGFLATLIMNSPYRDRVVFKDEHRTKTLTYILDIVNQHCPVITKDDIQKIALSNCFFARKFDLGTGPDAVYYYEKRILEDEE